MPLSTQTKHLAAYFSCSTEFFYIVTDSKGTCRIANPFFNGLFRKDGTEQPISTLFSRTERYFQLIQQCTEQKETAVAETLGMKMPDGSVKMVKWEFSACGLDNEMGVQAIGSIVNDVQDEPGKAGRVVGAIPDRYKAYEQSPEGLWRFDTASPVAADLDPDTIIAYWRKHSSLAECNDSLALMYGFEKAEDLIGSMLDQFMDFSDEERVENLREFIRNGLRSMQVETKEFDRYGNTKYFLNNMEGTIEDGMIIRVWGTQLDITGQRLAEEKNRYLASLVEYVSDIIISQDLDFNIVSWNKAAEEVYGYSAEEMMGRKIKDVLHFEYQDISRPQFFEIVEQQGSWKGEAYTINKAGKEITVLATITKIRNETGQHTGYVSVSKDITEKRRAEEQVLRSELFYRNLIAESLDGVLLTDDKGNVSFASPSVTKILGYEPEELAGVNVFKFVYPEDLEMAGTSFLEEVNMQPRVKFINIRLISKAGNAVWCVVRGHNMLDNPYVSRMVIYFADDSLRKNAEQALLESEKRFRNMIHNLQLGIILLNEKAEVLVCNQATLNMLGLTEEEFTRIGTSDPRWDLIHEDGTNFPQHARPIATAIRTKKPVRDVVMGLLRPSTNDRVWLLGNVEPILDDEENIINVICSFADITEQRRLSQQLIDQEVQRQRFITQATIDGQEKERQEIGKELHDNINQHLTTTRLYLEVASEKAEGDVLEMISLAHKTLKDIVNEIRRLSQSLVPPTLGDLGLAESIQDLCDSLRRTHSYKIEFHHRHFNEEGLPANLKLMIFRIIQEQVNNIIRHAQAKTIRIKLQADAENIIFSIADDGQGFDPEHYKKGMGISNISNRASLFSGKAEIDAAPGKGCTITITIPLAEQVNNLDNVSV